MKVSRILPGIALALAILVFGPLGGQHRLENQAAGLLGLALVCGSWLTFRWRKGQFIAATPLDIPLMALVISFTIATAGSLDPRRSLGQVQLLVGHILLFWILFDIFSSKPAPATDNRSQVASKPPRHRETGDLAGWVGGLMLVTGVVLMLAVAEVESWYLAWRSLPSALSPWPPFSYRLTSWLGHSNLFSALLTACGPLAAVGLARARSPLTKIGLATWWMAAVVGLVFASSRSGWLSLAAGLVVLAVIWKLARGRRSRRADTDLAGRGPHLETIVSRPAAAGRRWGRLARALLAGGVLLAIGWFAYRQFNDPTHDTILRSRAELWPPAWSAFVGSPLIGTGPATFNRHFLAANPLSQHAFAGHAHSVAFSLLAEEGILGFAAAGWVFIAGLRASLQSLRVSSLESRPWRLGAGAGLAGIGVHALSDNAATLPPVSLVLVLLAAIVLSGDVPGRRTRAAWAPALALLFLLGYGALTLPGHLAARRGVELARAHSFSRSAAEFDDAHDLDPGLAWYSIQAGYAHALLSEADGSQLEVARRNFEVGITLDPAYSVPWLNLAWVDWTAGDRVAALESIERAVALDPTSPLILLNQGWMLESSGDLDSARRQYLAALDADALQAASGYAAPHGSIPDLAHSLFWDSSPVRRRALQGWSPRVAPSAYAGALEAGHRQLGEGDLEAARESFFEARGLDPFRPEAFRGIGLTFARAGEADAARYYFQVAGLARGSAFERMLGWLDLMELEAVARRNPEAMQAGLRGFNVLAAYNSWGMGSDHANPYAWGVFYRESLPDDLLPWVLRPDMSTDLANRLLHLARLFDLAGNRPDACRVIERVLRAAPEFDPALAASELYACGS